MPIFLFNGSDFKKSKYRDSDHLIKAFDLERVEDARELDRWLNKGNNAYVFFDPYHSNMAGEEEGFKQRMFWTKDPETGKKQYDTSAEEV